LSCRCHARVRSEFGVEEFELLPFEFAGLVVWEQVEGLNTAVEELPAAQEVRREVGWKAEVGHTTPFR
jgi:hypothetical protein